MGTAAAELVSRGGLKRRRTEAGLLVLHFAGYLGAVFLVLSVPQAIVFILVNQALSVSTWAVLRPNHKDALLPS